MKLIVLLALFSQISFAQEQKIIYEYKKYEKIDLGNMEVKGQLLSPGDLSVRERDRQKFSEKLYERRDFKDNAAKDINSLR